MDIEKSRNYLINVLNKKLIASDEYSDDYRALAKKYWPDEFDKDETIVVHHIDGNHNNNVVSNLVPLTIKEHIRLHWLFDDRNDRIEKIRQSNTGKNLGKIASPETRAKLSNLHKGNHNSLGKKLSLETRRKISAATSNENNPMYGHKHSEHVKETISKKNKGRHRVYLNPEHTKWKMEY